MARWGTWSHDSRYFSFGVRLRGSATVDYYTISASFHSSDRALMCMKFGVQGRVLAGQPMFLYFICSLGDSNPLVPSMSYMVFMDTGWVE